MSTKPKCAVRCPRHAVEPSLKDPSRGHLTNGFIKEGVMKFTSWGLKTQPGGPKGEGAEILDGTTKREGSHKRVTKFTGKTH